MENEKTQRKDIPPYQEDVRRKLTDFLDETDQLSGTAASASAHKQSDEDDVIISPSGSAKRKIKSSTSEESEISAVSTNSSINSRKKSSATSTMSPLEAFQPVVGKFVATNEKGEEISIPMTVPNYQFVAAQQLHLPEGSDAAITASMQVNALSSTFAGLKANPGMPMGMPLTPMDSPFSTMGEPSHLLKNEFEPSAEPKKATFKAEKKTAFAEPAQTHMLRVELSDIVDLQDIQPSTSSSSLAQWNKYTSFLSLPSLKTRIEDIADDYYEDYGPHAFDNFDQEKESNAEKVLQNGYPAFGPLTRTDTIRLMFSRVRRHNQRLKSPTEKTADFYFVRTLGDGSFGSVYHVQDVKNGEQYAIKIMSKKDIKRERKLPYVVREKDIMTTLHHGFGGHPFIAKLHSSFQENNERICFVMEYAPHGELLEWLRRLGSFDLNVSRFFASEILEALDFIHRCGVIHRDLKPENILIKKDWHIMLTDFGSAKVQGFEGDEPSQVRRIMSQKNGETMRKERGSFVGTAFYISPEVAQSHTCGPEADFWALGCILYQMISGQPPFRGINEYQVTKKITQLDYKIPQGFDAVAADLIRELLVLEPTKRLGHNGAEAIKGHRFFEKIDFENITNISPPELKPFLPASGNQPAFYSNFKVPEHMEPGLTRKTMARLMGLDDFFTPSPSQLIKKVTPKQEKSEEAVRKGLLDAQRKDHSYHRFVEDNLILRSGLIDKKKGMFARRRMFLLTEGPRLFYVDPDMKELRGEIPITPSLRTEAKNFHTFFIHTPLRTYFLYDPDSHANEWCEAIEKARDKYCKPDAPELNFYPRGKIFTSKSKRAKKDRNLENDGKQKEKNALSTTNKWGRKSK